MVRRDLSTRAIMRRRGLRTEEPTLSCYPSKSSGPILGDPGSFRGSTGREGKLKTFGKVKMGFILSIGVVLLGCASVRDAQILDREVDILHSRVNALQKENKSLENKISALSAENQKLRTDVLFRLDNLQSEIRTLATGVEEYKDYLNRPSKEIGRIKEDVDGRLRVLEEGRKTLEEKNKAQEERIRGMEDRLKGMEGKARQAEPEKPVPSKEVPSKEAPSKGVPSEGKGTSAGMGDMYKVAYEAFQRGDNEGARKKFEAFLKQYPNTELSGHAQFWIGETYYLKKDFEKAILEYEKAITKYPEGSKVPAALFKQGLAFLELGDKANARNLFKRVVERYPRSEQAEMAKKKLDTMKPPSSDSKGKSAPSTKKKTP
jgi:tol-pal system protein YbgF